MPTYDYICQACGHEWEMFQSMNDSPAKSCPQCKKRKAKRQIGLGAGLIFKGTGFYETDYKDKKPPKSESSGDSSGDSKGSAKAGDSSSSSSDSSSSDKSDKKSVSSTKKEKAAKD